MIEAKQLIELNNLRRTELTPKNEEYYSDFMIYVRLHFFLSEQQSEEVLIEILDHLIEGQKEGKSAQEIFGEDPKAFADELISQIPNENRRSIGRFFTGIIFNLLSYFLLIRGIIILIISFFKAVDSTVFPLKAATISLLIVGFSLIGVWVFFRIIGNSLFKAKKNEVAGAWKAGLYGAGGMAVIIAAGYLLPEFGPSFDFSWYASLLSGGVLWGVSWVVKK